MPPSLFSQLRTLPRSFWILAGATFVNRFGLFVWPFLTIIITRNGNTAAQAGIAVSCYSLGSLCAAGLGGWLADRLGRNVTMAVSAFGSAAGMLAMSQFHDWHWLAGISLWVGLAGESGNPAIAAMVQDLVPPEKRIIGYSVLRFAGNLGWSFGPAVAGWLAESSFFGLFVVDAATSVFFGLVAWVLLPRGQRTPAHLAGWKLAWGSIRVNRPFLALCAAYLFGSWIFRQTVTTFPLHFERSGLPVHWVGSVLAVNGIMIVLLEIPISNATRAWPVRVMLGLGYLLMGSSFLLLIGESALPAFVATIVAFTLGEMIAFSRQQAYAASLAPDDMRGRYAGFLSIAWSLGGIFSSVAALGLYEQSPAAVWMVTAIFGVVAALLMGKGGRPRVKKET